MNKIHKYQFKPDLFIEFEIIEIRDLYHEAYDKITSPHRANFYHIVWFQTGITNHWIDFRTLEIKDNTLLFIEKDVVHAFAKEASNIAGKAILFTDNFFGKTEADTNLLDTSILFNDLLAICQIDAQNNTQIFENLISLMMGEFNHDVDSFQANILRNYLHNFMLLAERLRRKQNFIELPKSLELNYVLEFKQIVNKEFKHQKKVSFFAEKLNISEKRLNKALSKILNKTAKEIIDERIILEAKRLLTNTTLSTKEIAYELGYDEPTNFIKFFKKHEAITPSVFKEKLYHA